MSTVTITNPTTPVQEPTPITNSPLTITGNGSVGVELVNVVNDGNTVNTIAWSVTNVLNGSLQSTSAETGSVTNHGATGTKVVNPGQSVKITAWFNVPVGEPGVTNNDCTADYSAQWQ